MKQLSFLLFAAVLIFIVGCSKMDPVSSSVITDDEAIQEMTLSDESVAEFSQSVESTISDDGEIEWAKYGFDAPMTDVKVFRWGRRIVSIDRNVAVTYIGDSMAVALLTRVVNGNLVIAASYSDTASLPDTLIRKPFHERLQRKVIFSRIARTDNPRRNWRPVAISLVAGGTIPDSLNNFTIQKLEFYTSADTYSVTDPLNTWLRMGALRDRVPIVHHNDMVLVRLTVVSSDDSTEAVALRWVGDEHSPNLRERMELVSTTNVAGGYERVYEKTIHTRLRLGRAVGRFNVVADVNSWGTLNDDAQPVSNRMWGFPYDVRRP